MTSPAAHREDGRTEHIAWTRTGDRTDILFLHGFSDNGDCWNPIVAALGDRWGSLALDARGHGKSGLPDGAHGRVEQATDAAMVLDAVTLPAGGAIVVGHSMGAGTAIELASIRPDLVRGLVLEDPVLRTPEDGPRNRPAPPDPGAPQPPRPTIAERIAQGRADNPRWADDEFEAWARSKDELADEFTQRRGPEDTPALAVLNAVSCPVLLVRGDPDRGSIVTPAAAVAAVAAGAGRVREVHIEGVGHSVRREARDRFLVAFGAFLGEYAA